MLSAAALLMGAAMAAQASDTSWPQRPIRLIVPFPAGASTEVIARVLGQKLGQDLG
jgi:tripartite-type tricarboxylate transporter receptor subunit TctC